MKKNVTKMLHYINRPLSKYKSVSSFETFDLRDLNIFFVHCILIKRCQKTNNFYAVYLVLNCARISGPYLITTYMLNT